VAAYLATVSWWRPKPEHRQDEVLLEGLFFYLKHAGGFRYGYDPFGRLVIGCPAARAFALSWPTGDAVGNRQDGCETTGEQAHRFTRLPDGRLDLVPVPFGQVEGDRGVCPWPGPTVLTTGETQVIVGSAITVRCMGVGRGGVPISANCGILAVFASEPRIRAMRCEVGIKP
jgi:hypothetical protein